MTTGGWLQFIVFAAAVLALTKPLGLFMARVFGRERTFHDPIFRPERVPSRRLEYRGVVLEEMGVDAVVRRRPEVALVDELAHTNVPGSNNRKRYEDVLELLDSGIFVRALPSERGEHIPLPGGEPAIGHGEYPLPGSRESSSVSPLTSIRWKRVALSI